MARRPDPKLHCRFRSSPELNRAMHCMLPFLMLMIAILGKAGRQVVAMNQRGHQFRIDSTGLSAQN